MCALAMVQFRIGYFTNCKFSYFLLNFKSSSQIILSYFGLSMLVCFYTILSHHVYEL